MPSGTTVTSTSSYEVVSTTGVRSARWFSLRWAPLRWVSLRCAPLRLVPLVSAPLVGAPLVGAPVRRRRRGRAVISPRAREDWELEIWAPGAWLPRGVGGADSGVLMLRGLRAAMWYSK